MAFSRCHGLWLPFLAIRNRRIVLSYPCVGEVSWKNFSEKTSAYLRLLTWTVAQTDGAFVVRTGHTRLALSRDYLFMMLTEWGLWRRYYLPKFSLQGKVVLDVGAGCGETAYFYFKHGASKVICVESNEEALANLRRNCSRNNWNVEILDHPFELGDINREYDFMKVDCEGGEVVLLSSERDLRQCVIEVHSADLRQKFMSKFKLQELFRLSENTWILGTASVMQR